MTKKAPKRFTFKKSARLSRKKYINELFDRGSSFLIHPFKVLYLPDNENRITCHQILISAPKKFHKTAVARNRIKRLVREAYRLNQHILPAPEGKFCFIAYIYISRDVPALKEVETKLKMSLIRLKNIVYEK